MREWRAKQSAGAGPWGLVVSESTGKERAGRRSADGQPESESEMESDGAALSAWGERKDRRENRGLAVWLAGYPATIAGAAFLYGGFDSGEIGPALMALTGSAVVLSLPYAVGTAYLLRRYLRWREARDPRPEEPRPQPSCVLGEHEDRGHLLQWRGE